jgi:hypothetical protein
MHALPYTGLLYLLHLARLFHAGGQLLVIYYG